MAKYIISYNPYQNTTQIEKNGTTLKKNCSLCKGIDNKRLQAWFDIDESWEGFGKALDVDNNEIECNIQFYGRKIDFFDLKDYFDTVYKSEKGTRFHLESKFLSNDEDILSKLSDFVEEAKENGVFENGQLATIKKYIDDIKKTPFPISVIATMSAGKSTLINALIHKELLPTGDDATTANIVEIYDNSSETVEYSTFDKDEKMICKGSNADLAVLKEINADNNVRTVKLYCKIPCNTNKILMMLRDTPGPNNSQDIQHKKITESIIFDADNMSTVIYVMNATELRVESEKELLHNIACEMKKGGKQANDRFLFVINKVDLRLKNKEQTLEGLIKDTKEYLAQFGITNPRIFPVTASLACDIQKCKAGYKFDELIWPTVEVNLKMFNMDSSRVKFDLYASVSPSVRRKLDEELKIAADNENIYETAMIHSGIRGLEYSIQEYMEKYAYPIKVSDAVKDIIETIDENEMRNNFREILAEDDKKLKKTQKTIEDIEKKKRKEKTQKKTS